MLCWNRWEDVNVSLSRIDQIDYSNLETIVVDNGSTDEAKKHQGTVPMGEVNRGRVQSWY